jgi:hypothetical protein
MATYVSGMPLWVIVLFIAGFLYSIAFIANPAKQAAVNAGMSLQKARNIQVGIFAFYIIYLGYASILSLNGVFYVVSVPPKVTVFTSLPLAIILFVIIGNTSLFKKLLQSITLESLIAMHVFRVLGIFFILIYLYHLAPMAFSFSAGFGDIITAILALPVAKMVAKKKPGSRTWAYAWNILGAMDIITLLAIAVVTSLKSVNSGELKDMEMTMFPFVWFPAFAPATLLFLHVTIFRKLHQTRIK